MTFQPGQSRNPAGRPRGTRAKTTILAEQWPDPPWGDSLRDRHVRRVRVAKLFQERRL
jgi:hypothetical protein